MKKTQIQSSELKVNDIYSAEACGSNMRVFRKEFYKVLSISITAVQVTRVKNQKGKIVTVGKPKKHIRGPLNRTMTVYRLTNC